MTTRQHNYFNSSEFKELKLNLVGKQHKEST